MKADVSRSRVGGFVAGSECGKRAERYGARCGAEGCSDGFCAAVTDVRRAGIHDVETIPLVMRHTCTKG